MRHLQTFPFTLISLSRTYSLALPDGNFREQTGQHPSTDHVRPNCWSEAHSPHQHSVCKSIRIQSREICSANSRRSETTSFYTLFCFWVSQHELRIETPKVHRGVFSSLMCTETAFRAMQTSLFYPGGIGRSLGRSDNFPALLAAVLACTACHTSPQGG